MGKTTFVLALMTFYVVIFIVLGLVNEEMNTDYGTSTSLNISSVDEPSTTNSSGLSAVYDVILGIFNFGISALKIFFSGLAFSIVGLPVWASTILFMPLAATLIWVLASSFAPGGGG